MKGRWGIRTENLIGRTFGKLIVLSFGPKRKDGRFPFICKCVCGKTKEVLGKELKNGRIVSCGCYKSEMTRIRKTTHGMSGTRLFKIWMDIKKRCLNPKMWAFKYYGGRGIKICERWKDFLNFHADMSRSYLKHLAEYGEKNTTLERIKNDLGYFNENCKWATRKEQANNKSNNKTKGEKHEV